MAASASQADKMVAKHQTNLANRKMEADFLLAKPEARLIYEKTRDRVRAC